MSSSSCLPLLARLPITSTLPSIFPLIMCFRRKSLRKLRPIQLAFLRSIVYGMFLSHLSLCNTSYYTRCPTDLLHPSQAPHLRTLKVFLTYFPKCPGFSSMQNCAPALALYRALYSFFLESKNKLLNKTVFLLNSAFAISFLDLISRVYLASSVIMLST